MMTIHYLASVIAAGSGNGTGGVGTGGTGSTSGITAWLMSNVLGLLILVLGLFVLWLAKKKNLSDSLTVVAGVMLGLLVVGLAANGNGVTVGQWLASMVF